ncbi:DUF922 domain-containing protein [uncultured Kordia sp.]|uniref:DUF922 domain-containing protein n=1 Tax=uncultured Kordia sp. TaxID=507699 RepID=UPI002634AD68|nr:DUF922 domain-containing protein [uncultured Kordia sp.]
MYKLLGVLCLFLFVQNEETITWDANTKLYWGNFQGEPERNSDAVAITASGITYGFSSKSYSNSSEIIEYTTSVVAQFYPKKSWYLKERVNDTVLGHEQLHFDITELHARKFRKRIKETKFTKNIKEELNKIYAEINISLQQMQNEYDNGSDYSRSYEGQIAWQKRVARELRKYKKYELPVK